VQGFLEIGFMSTGCCSATQEFDGASSAFKRALWVVIAINGIMFAVEISAGAFAGSKALQADALDFLGDTATYSMSLYVIGMSLRTRATAALVKGFSLGCMGAWVLGTAIYQSFVLGVPKADVMGVIGALALSANIVSVFVLMRFKDGDSNVRSVWLCSRNDAIGNVAVMIAALGVWYFGTAWPDLIVAVFMAGLFSRSAIQIVRQALSELSQVSTEAAE